MTGTGRSFTEWSNPETAISQGSDTYVAAVIVKSTSPDVIYGMSAVNVASLSDGSTYTIGSATEDCIQFGKFSTHFSAYYPIVGGIGPAGGYIFYDCDADNDATNDGSGSDGLRSDVCGWRYLEAAPSDISACPWGDDGTFGTKTGIGEGKNNTDIIVNNASTQITDTASKACLDYEVNCYDDWFLPSKDELILMYNNLHKKGIGNFSNTYYWSSSEYSNTTHGCDHKFNSDDNDIGLRNTSRAVRAVRAFK